jgi:2-oxo-4-hydroxy-4-carboxy-5-ureidoimidazoline decarboxylase
MSDAFVARFGHVYEDSPGLAAAVFARGPYSTDADLIAAFESVTASLSDDEVLALLQAHPRLGTRGPMGASSTAEQQGAGLVAEGPVVAEIRRGSVEYEQRFGFPFIIAVSGLMPTDIAAALRERLQHDAATERAEALRQVQRIARLRVEAVLGS